MVTPLHGLILTEIIIASVLGNSVASHVRASTCQPLYNFDETAILLATSEEKGATLLTARSVDLKQCVQECCSDFECDTLVYHRQKEYCYLVKCGIPSKCSYVKDERYISYFFKRKSHEPDDQETGSRKLKGPAHKSIPPSNSTKEKITNKKDSTVPTRNKQTDKDDVPHQSKTERNGASDSVLSVNIENSLHEKLTHKMQRKPSSTSLKNHGQDLAKKIKAASNKNDSATEAQNSKRTAISSHLKNEENHTALLTKKDVDRSRELSKSYLQLKVTVIYLRVAVAILSICLALSFIFTLFVICRSKIIINRLSSKKLMIPTRGEESDFLINGIYS